LQNRDRKIMNPVTGFGKCGGTVFERRRAEAVIPPRGDKLEQESAYECGSGGWPEPHFYFSYR